MVEISIGKSPLAHKVGLRNPYQYVPHEWFKLERTNLFSSEERVHDLFCFSVWKCNEI